MIITTLIFLILNVLLYIKVIKKCVKVKRGYRHSSDLARFNSEGIQNVTFPNYGLILYILSWFIPMVNIGVFVIFLIITVVMLWTNSNNTYYEDDAWKHQYSINNTFIDWLLSRSLSNK